MAEEGGHEVNFGMVSLSFETTLTLITLLFLLGDGQERADPPSSGCRTRWLAHAG